MAGLTLTHITVLPPEATALMSHEGVKVGPMSRLIRLTR